MASPIIVIAFFTQGLKLANIIVMEIVKIKLPPPPKEGIHQLALLLVPHWLGAVVCLSLALEEITEPHTSHFSILKGKEDN